MHGRSKSLQADFNHRQPSNAKLAKFFATCADYMLGSSSMLRTILKRRPDAIHWRHRLCGGTGLHIAAGHDNESNVLILIKAGAEVDATDNAGNTPLMRAAMSGSRYAAETLLLHQADILRQNKRGRTVLAVAVENNQFEFMKFLFKQGANPFISDNDNIDVLTVARENCAPKLVRALEEYITQLEKVREEDAKAARQGLPSAMKTKKMALRTRRHGGA